MRVLFPEISSPHYWKADGGRRKKRRSPNKFLGPLAYARGRCLFALGGGISGAVRFSGLREIAWVSPGLPAGKGSGRQETHSTRGASARARACVHHVPPLGGPEGGVRCREAKARAAVRRTGTPETPTGQALLSDRGPAGRQHVDLVFWSKVNTFTGAPGREYARRNLNLGYGSKVCTVK